jgi:hypothetical protein
MRGGGERNVSSAAELVSRSIGAGLVITLAGLIIAVRRSVYAGRQSRYCGSPVG